MYYSKEAFKNYLEVYLLNFQIQVEINFIRKFSISSQWRLIIFEFI